MKADIDAIAATERRPGIPKHLKRLLCRQRPLEIQPSSMALANAPVGQAQLITSHRTRIAHPRKR